MDDIGKGHDENDQIRVADIIPSQYQHFFRYSKFNVMQSLVVRQCLNSNVSFNVREELN